MLTRLSTPTPENDWLTGDAPPIVTIGLFPKLCPVTVMVFAVPPVTVEGVTLVITGVAS
jgi:hypothetical protein